MLVVSQTSFVLAAAVLTAALVALLIGLVRARAIVAAPAAGHPTGWSPVLSGDAARRHLVLGGLAALTIGLLTRAVAVGHGPFANQFEFAVAFAWGAVAVYAYVDRRHRAALLGVVVVPFALAMLLYAATVGARTAPLVPALQHQVLLTVHVLAAVLGYGAAAVACAAAALSLLRERLPWPGLPGVGRLDELAYRAVVIAFPLLTVAILLGAVWAERAWGTYWNWDPKETSALATWLIYGGYLHARVARGWRGRRAAWLLVAGFAAVLVTYFGNLFFGGLHSYA